MSALTVEGLTKDFGGLRAVDHVTLTAEPGERLAIIGPNGAGKTTFFNLITGLFPPSAGKIALFDREMTHLPIHQRAQLGLARTFQITTLFQNLTVLQSVLLAVQASDSVRFTLHRPLTSYPHLLDRAQTLLSQWGLAERKDTLTKHLSYGEQRQLELVLALAGTPKVLLLDEPTAGLSPAETTSVSGMMQRLPREITILIIEHDMDVAFDLADRIVVLFQGRILAQGTKEEIRKNQEVAEIYLGTDHA